MAHSGIIEFSSVPRPLNRRSKALTAKGILFNVISALSFVVRLLT